MDYNNIIIYSSIIPSKYFRESILKIYNKIDYIKPGSKN